MKKGVFPNKMTYIYIEFILYFLSDYKQQLTELKAQMVVLALDLENGQARNCQFSTTAIIPVCSKGILKWFWPNSF
jgi:hypothetical protein